MTAPQNHVSLQLASQTQVRIHRPLSGPTCARNTATRFGRESWVPAMEVGTAPCPLLAATLSSPQGGVWWVESSPVQPSF